LPEKAGRWLACLSQIITKKKITLTEVTNEPILAIKFQYKKESGKSAYRRGIPAKPKKCIGKNVKFTPTNIAKNCLFNQVGCRVNPVNKGYHVTNPPNIANTAPILST